MRRVNQAFGRCACCVRRAEFRVVFQPPTVQGNAQDAVAEYRCARHVQRGHGAIQFHAIKRPVELPSTQRPWTTLSVLVPRRRAGD
jgi:hypothetical protein